jgi:tetratricopeptide (TPR) repeat protein
MPSPISRTLLVVMLCIGTSLGQSRANGTDLHVRVMATDGKSAGYKLRVELLSITGIPAADAYTDDAGNARFPNLRSGGYRLRVSGMGILETIGDSFRIDPEESSHVEYVSVQREAPKDPQVKGPASVNVANLSVPSDAEDAFTKGVEALNRNKLGDARKHLEKAIKLYPTYPSAYNMLGIALMRDGNAEGGQQAFEKAVAIDDRYALAYTNLAKIYFAKREMQRCEALLEKSLAAEPRSPETLAIMSQVEFMVGKYEQAVVSARRMHDLPDHKDFAVAHLIAARALTARNQQQDAVVEYKLFLQEAPSSSPSASKAREELKELEKHP